MGAQVIPHKSGGTLVYEELGSGWRRGHIRERVTIANNSSHTMLTRQIPEGARVVWSCLKNVTAIAVDIDGGTTSAAAGTGGYALALHTSTTVTSLSTSATTDMLLRSAVTSAITGTFPIDSSARGIEKNDAVRENLTDPGDATDGAKNIFVAPAVFTTGDGAIYTFWPDSATATNKYYFTVAGTLDVDIWFDEFAETPNNA